MGAVVVKQDDHEVVELVGGPLAADDQVVAAESWQSLDDGLVDAALEPLDYREVLEQYRLTEEAWEQRDFEERLEHARQLDAALLESGVQGELLEDVARRERLLAELRVVARDTLEQFSGMVRLNDEMRALGVFVADERPAVYVEPSPDAADVGDDHAASGGADDVAGDLATDLVDALLPGALNDAALAGDVPSESGLGDVPSEDEVLGDGFAEPLLADVPDEGDVLDGALLEAVADAAEALDVLDAVSDEVLARGERLVDQVATLSEESVHTGA